MALDAADWTISVTGDIRWTGSGTATNVTVLELHRFVQDLADDAVAVAASDDLLQITNETPSNRATDNILTLINGYNVDDTAIQHIYDGSITQDAGDTEYLGLVVVGAVETGTEIQIVQNNAHLTSYWGTGLNPDAAANILLRIMIKCRVDGADIDGRRLLCTAKEYGDTYSEFSVTMGDGNNTAALFTGPDLNNTTVVGTVAAYDKLDNVLEGYQLLDVTAAGSQEPFYSQWQVTGTGTLPASPVINDLYEWAKYVQRRTSTTTIHGMDGDLFRGINLDVDFTAQSGTLTTNDDYAWGTFLTTGTITGTFQVGEKITGGTSGAIGRLLSVDTTGTAESFVIDTESGTWQNGEVITGFTSTATATTDNAPVGQATGGGVGRILAALDSGTTGTVWYQLLKGTAPSGAVMYRDAVGGHTEVMTAGTVTARTLTPSFIGTSTGSAIIGSFGLGIDPDDLTASDALTDLENVPAPPPNNVTFTVSGLVNAEDRVLVGPEALGVLEVDQDTINDTGLNTSGITSVTVTTAIPSDTPASGNIRITADDGRILRVPYSSYTGSVYTIPSFDFTSPNNCTTGNNIFIAYIDEIASGTTAAFTSVFNTTRPLFVRVRDGGTAGDLEGIKTFETPADLTSAGGGATAVRTPDV